MTAVSGRRPRARFERKGLLLLSSRSGPVVESQLTFTSECAFQIILYSAVLLWAFLRKAISAEVMSGEIAYAIECLRDDEKSSESIEVLRANLEDPKAVEEWLQRYSAKTNTSWIVHNSKPPEACRRYSKLYASRPSPE